jgi:hypothetical protein
MRMRTFRLFVALSAGLVASFAVPAYAAGMLGDGGGLASGAGPAMACDRDGVTTRYSVAGGADGFVVDAVSVEGIDAACAGGTVHVEVRASDGSVVGTGSTVVSTATERVVLAAMPPAAAVGAVQVILAR